MGPLGLAVLRKPEAIRRQILSLVEELHEATVTPPFVAGDTYVPYGGRVYDHHEVVAAVGASLDFWLTLGPHGDQFQQQLAALLGVRWSLLVNSGSSANLVAMAALTSPKVPGRLIPGDEVITVAAGFPTTVAPIVQLGCVPVFVDANPTTGNVRTSALDEALSSRTRAVMLAHTLGNPFDIDAVKRFCDQHDLFLIEDNCDALGSTYKGKLTGAFGDLSTQSFYPPHHITMGEGGAVNIPNSSRLKVAVESFRDWGRDCWCPSGKDNTCGKRFAWQFEQLPVGYDHKYVYSHLGYNLKPTDIQAAIGVQQLAKLADFTAARRANYAAYAQALRPFRAVLRPVEATPGSDPSWFGFMMIVQPKAPFSRTDLTQHLEAHKIGTRMLFGGNLLRQPAFTQLAADAKDQNRDAPFRVVGELKGADQLMRHAFFLGTYPGIDAPRRDYIVQVLTDYLTEKTGIR